MALYKNHLFPFAYALTTSKDEVTCDILFRELKNIAETEGFDLKPTTMMSDFELANINQAKAHFPRVRIKNCLFHFSQNIWRNCVERGLKTANADNKPIRQRIMHLFGLPFVPLVDDVEEVFNMLQDDEEMPDELLEVYDMIERTYIFGVPVRGRRRAVAPRFPPEQWNVYDSVIHEKHRTNNMVEGYHNKFQKSIQVKN